LAFLGPWHPTSAPAPQPSLVEVDRAPQVLAWQHGKNTKAMEISNHNDGCKKSSRTHL